MKNFVILLLFLIVLFLVNPNGVTNKEALDDYFSKYKLPQNAQHKNAYSQKTSKSLSASKSTKHKRQTTSKYANKYRNSNTGQNGSSRKIPGFRGFSYKIEQIPQKAVSYLKDKSEYSRSYNGRRRFIVYYSDEGASCYYVRTFSSKMKALTQQKRYFMEYEFYPHKEIKFSASAQYADGAAWFYNNCSVMCIVNPVKGEMFSIQTMGMTEIDNLENILTTFKEW